jgi:hypothetical protein
MRVRKVPARIAIGEHTIVGLIKPGLSNLEGV